MVNLSSSQGLKRLAVHTIPLVTSDESEEGKLSSSDIRKAMLGVYQQVLVRHCPVCVCVCVCVCMCVCVCVCMCA